MNNRTAVLLMTGFFSCGAPLATLDAGLTDAGTGTCAPVEQTGCAATEKCTVRLDTGASTCGPVGTVRAYEACAADSDCVAGTVCTPLPGNSQFQGGQTCRPLCHPPTQAHLACAQGGSCEFVNTHDSTLGFCAKRIEAADAGVDGGH